MLHQSFSRQDFLKLRDFLQSDNTPSNCMNIYSLNGLLSCLLIGPDTILPNQWLPVIWQESESENMIWGSIEEANQFIGLIMTYYNSIASTLQGNANSYQPSPFDQGDKADQIKDWCMGFLSGIELSQTNWEPLLKSKQDQVLIAPLLLFATEDGLNILNNNSEDREYTPDDWTEMIRLMVIAIYQFWLPHRKIARDSTQPSMSQKIGRNEPCPCGSGKKFKNCCLY